MARNLRLKFKSLGPVLTIRFKVNMVLKNNNDRDFEARLFQWHVSASPLHSPKYPSREPHHM